jgi:3-oxoacyl-[acyl-carrier-protein] synthase-1
MSTGTSLSILASGMVTAVGFNSPASCAAIRAGISGTRESHLWHAQSGQYLTAAKVQLPQWWHGLGKLADLVAPAIHECLAAAGNVPAAQIPLLLGVAGEERPFRLEGLEEQLLREIESRLEVRFHGASQCMPRGQVSGVAGLQAAERLLSMQRVPCCIIAGVDSLLEPRVADAYVRRRRLLTPDNSNGFIPGEAGCAVLVGHAAPRAEQLRVLGMSLTRERASIESEEPLRAEGLTQAVREALAQAGLTLFDVDYRITDLNGEHYKFKEAALAIMRFQRKEKEQLFELWHPIEYLGEVGAAIGPCVLGLALHAGQKGYAPGQTALCHFGSDDGERAVVVVRFQQGGRA